MHSRCHICESEATRRFQGHIGYQSDLKFDIYHCDHCETAFVSPLAVDEHVYEHIYTNIKAIPGYNRYSKYHEQVRLEREPLNYLADSEDTYWSIRE